MKRFIGNAIYCAAWCLAFVIMASIGTAAVLAMTDNDERMTGEEWSAAHYDSIQDRADCAEVVDVNETAITLRGYTLSADGLSVDHWLYEVPRALFPDVSDTDVEICPEYYIN